MCFFNPANMSCCFSLQSEVEVSNLNRRIRNMEDEMEQLTTKLRTTNDKLEDIAKAANECERLIHNIITLITTTHYSKYSYSNLYSAE